MMADGTVSPPEPRTSFELADAKAAAEEAQQVFPGGAGKVMLSSVEDMHMQRKVRWCQMLMWFCTACGPKSLISAAIE